MTEFVCLVCPRPAVVSRGHVHPPEDRRSLLSGWCDHHHDDGFFAPIRDSSTLLRQLSPDLVPRCDAPSGCLGPIGRAVLQEDPVTGRERLVLNARVERREPPGDREPGQVRGPSRS